MRHSTLLRIGITALVLTFYGGTLLAQDCQARVGVDGVSAPVLLTKTEPEYSAEARAKHIDGTVVLALCIDEDGRTEQFSVVKSLGYGLDQQAIAALARWRFRPAMKDGKPVKVGAQIDVSFRLGYDSPAPPTEYVYAPHATDIGTSPTQSWSLVRKGQSKDSVHTLIGQPNRPTSISHNVLLWEEWANGNQILEVQYDKDGIVQWVHSFVLQPDPPAAERPSWWDTEPANGAKHQSKVATVVNKVLNIADGVYLQHYCPQVYRIPVAFMNAGQYQLLQQCDANGFMFFGVYLYTGGKQ